MKEFEHQLSSECMLCSWPAEKAAISGISAQWDFITKRPRYQTIRSIWKWKNSSINCRTNICCAAGRPKRPQSPEFLLN